MLKASLLPPEPFIKIINMARIICRSAISLQHAKYLSYHSSDFSNRAGYFSLNGISISGSNFAL